MSKKDKFSIKNTEEEDDGRFWDVPLDMSEEEIINPTDEDEEDDGQFWDTPFPW